MKQPEPARPTVRELAERFVHEYVAVYLKGESRANYRRHLAEHILPALGDRDFESVTRSDVQRLHASLRTIPATANYVVNVIGSLYKRIITDWGLSDMRHPTHGVKLFKMRRRACRFPEQRAARRGIARAVDPKLASLGISSSVLHQGSTNHA